MKKLQNRLILILITITLIFCHTLAAQDFAGNLVMDFMPEKVQEIIRDRQRYIRFTRESIMEANAKCLAELNSTQRQIREYEQEIREASARASAEGKPVDESTIVSVYTGGFSTIRSHRQAIENLLDQINWFTDSLRDGGCGLAYTGGFTTVRSMKQSIEEAEKEITFYLTEYLPQPGTPEYKDFEKRILQRLRDNGINTNKLVDFQNTLMGRIKTMQPGSRDLPGYLESLNMGDMEAPPGADVVQWRAALMRSAKTWWLKTLVTNNEESIKDGLRRQADALAKFDQTLQLEAEAAYEEIVTNQKKVEAWMSILPAVGDAADILSMLRGEKLSGEKLTTWDYVFGIGMAIGPFAVSKAYSSSPTAQKVLEALKDKVVGAGAAGKRYLSKTMKVAGEKMDALVSTVRKESRKKITQWKNKLKTKMGEAMENFSQSSAKQEVLQRHTNLKEGAEKIVKDLQDNLKNAIDPSSQREAIKELMQSKTAKNLFNNEQQYTALRKEASDIITEVYAEVDNQVFKQISDSDEVLRIQNRYQNKLSQYGDEVLEAKVTTKNMTNVTDGPVKFGRDRDVTYVVEIKTKSGLVIQEDLNPNKLFAGNKNLEDIYFEEFYKSMNSGKTATAVEMKKFSKEMMEQNVTFRYSADAYTPGDNNPIKKVLLNIKEGYTPSYEDIDTMRRTIEHKSYEFFAEADNTIRGSVEWIENTTEGLRQMKKQYKNILEPRVNRYANSLGKNIDEIVSVEMKQAVEIIENIEKMDLPLEEGLEQLKVLGFSSPSDLVSRFGNTLEKVERGIADSYRAGQTQFLDKCLDYFSKTNSVEGLDRGIKTLNNRLWNGKVSYTSFTSKRKQFLDAQINALKKAGDAGKISGWAAGALKDETITFNEWDRIMQSIN